MKSFKFYFIFTLCLCLPVVLAYALTAQTNIWSTFEPLSSYTPGAVLSNLTIEQICTKGYVSKNNVRHVTQAQERAIFINYLGHQPAKRSDYEIDHLISLELGGSNDSSNLWPQSYITLPWNAHVKDRLEDYLACSLRKDLAANGHEHATLLLKQYQTEISHSWTNTYIKYLGQPK